MRRISAEEFLAAKAAAAANGTDKPPFRELLNELDRQPELQAELALDLLRVSITQFEANMNPASTLMWMGPFGYHLTPDQRETYIANLENLIVRSFADWQALASEVHDRIDFREVLQLALLALRIASEDRWHSMLDSLGGHARESKRAQKRVNGLRSFFERKPRSLKPFLLYPPREK